MGAWVLGNEGEKAGPWNPEPGTRNLRRDSAERIYVTTYQGKNSNKQPATATCHGEAEGKDGS